MAPRPMSKVVAEACNRDAVNILLCDSELGLSALEPSNLLQRQMRHTCRRNTQPYLYQRSYNIIYAPRQCSKRLCDAAGQT